MTSQYECSEAGCKFECYNPSVARKHMDKLGHQVVVATVKDKQVIEVKEQPATLWLDGGWEPGVGILCDYFGGTLGYEVSYYGRRIGIYDTEGQALGAIEDWGEHADTCETCSDGFPGAASHV
jgi:hypothetical protein